MHKSPLNRFLADKKVALAFLFFAALPPFSAGMSVEVPDGGGRWESALKREQPSTAIPFSELGARATRECMGRGTGIEKTAHGARLHTSYQKLVGHATNEGLQIDSVDEGGGSLRLVGAAIKRMDPSDHTELNAKHIPKTGTVIAGQNNVLFERSGLIEDYSVSVDGIRQDFIITERLRGPGSLKLELALSGAKAAVSPSGVRLMLDHGGRELAYSRLHVADATGRELDAAMEVIRQDCIAVHVADSGAAYPLRIDPTFSDADWIGSGGIIGVYGYVNAMASDGAGNLYVGGSFKIAGGVIANGVAKWDGTSWSSLGQGVELSEISDISAVAVSGNNVYVAGSFTSAGGIEANRIAKWDGSAWSALGTGLNETVRALAISSSGEVYAGGAFTEAGGVEVNRIAKWDGNTWSPLGTGMEGNSIFQIVTTLAVAGGKLYAAGAFETAGGVPADGIAMWNGNEWSALGSGLDGGVSAMAVSGNDLYVGGWFTNAGGVMAQNIAKWNGNGWSEVGSGLDFSPDALAVSSGEIYAAGTFVTPDQQVANGVVKWNGTEWSMLGSGVGGFSSAEIESLTVLNGILYAGGNYTTNDGLQVNSISSWQHGKWNALGRQINPVVYSIAAGDGKLFAGGDFSLVSGMETHTIGQWDGAKWVPLGTGLEGWFPIVQALLYHEGKLYVGGAFSKAGGITSNNIAVWDGVNWSALGSGFDGDVCALAMMGGNLYAGGFFEQAGDTSVYGIAKWDGSSWSPLHWGVDEDDFGYPAVLALAVSGGELYAGGQFSTAGGIAVNHVARWNGVSWNALGPGLNGNVHALAVLDGCIYAGGTFDHAGTTPTNFIAKWDGSTWSALGTGITGGGGHRGVNALAALNGDLYAAGNFTSAGGLSANSIAKWDGSVWSPLGTGMPDGSIHALVIDNGVLHAGGSFLICGGKVAPYLARAHLSSSLSITSPSTAFGAIGYPAHFQVTASGNPSQFSATGLPPGLTISATHGLIGGTPTLAGTFLVNLSVADQSASASSNLTIEIASTLPLSSWRQIYFGTSSNSGDAHDGADKDADGLSNLMEYAFALNPLQHSANQMPQWQRVGDDLRLSFTPPAATTGLSYKAEWSQTMAPGSWQPLGNTGISPQQTFTLPMSPGTKKFARLRVSTVY